MFTGLITATSTCQLKGNKLSFLISELPTWWRGVNVGDSIAVNGVCLTVHSIDHRITFLLSNETMEIVHIGHKVNLEKALRFGDPMGGHLVTGHVQCLGTCERIEDNEYWFNYSYNYTPRLKGSITVNGVSLTVSEVKKSSFKVSLIPQTLIKTTLSELKVGDKVNLEFEGKTEYHDRDEMHMRQAIEIGQTTRGLCSPNPWVGCVVVCADIVLGIGHHKGPGTPHAEVMAINDVIDNYGEEVLTNSTLYCTLEPCSHFGRTPPCDQLILKYKIPKVVIGVLDPDLRVDSVSGLERAGVKVKTGVRRLEIERLMEPYFYHRRTGMPYCIGKVAASMDGKIGLENGNSKWITSEGQRAHAKTNLRGNCDAILVGWKTVFHDNPSLTTKANANLTRLILDSKGSLVEEWDKYTVFTDDFPTVIITEKSTPIPIDFPKRVLRVESTRNVTELLRNLSSYLSILVEGGPTVLQFFLPFLNELYLYEGNCILGEKGVSWSALTTSPFEVKDVKRWTLVENFMDGTVKRYKPER